MHILFPSKPFDIKAADESYEVEYEAFHSAGLPCSLFSPFDFGQGVFKPWPSLTPGDRVLYRGWMLKPEEYRRLHAAISIHDSVPLTTPDQYQALISTVRRGRAMKMVMEKLATLLIGLGCLSMGRCDAAGAPLMIQRCDQATTVRPGMGRSFTGLLENSDYAFAVSIPNQMTAWDGVWRDAPFHGFVLFLDPQLQACIVFEVHVRVDDEDAPTPSPSSVQMRLGEALAWQDHNSDGRLVSIRTTFSFHQADQIDDGEILLITPGSQRERARGIYDAFVRSLTFAARIGTTSEAVHQ
jgi:hypothetical protein